MMKRSAVRQIAPKSLTISVTDDSAQPIHISASEETQTDMGRTSLEKLELWRHPGAVRWRLRTLRQGPTSELLQYVINRHRTDHSKGM